MTFPHSYRQGVCATCNGLRNYGRADGFWDVEGRGLNSKTRRAPATAGKLRTLRATWFIAPVGCRRVLYLFFLEEKIGNGLCAEELFEHELLFVAFVSL